MANILISVDSFPPDFSGAGLRAKRFCDRYAKKFSSGFIVMTQSRPQKQESGEVEVDQLRLPSSLGLMFPYFLLVAFFKVTALLKKKQKSIDLIHMYSFSWMSRMLMLSNALFFHRPAILEITLDGDDDPMSLLNKGSRNRLLRSLTGHLLKKIDKFVVPSGSTMESCLRAGIPQEKIWLRPHPVDEEIFGSIPLAKKRSLRKKLGLPDRYIMLNIGMLYARKNQMFLLRCLSMIKAQDLFLVLIGPKDPEDDSYFESLKDFISKNDLTRKVLILSPQKNIEEYMAASDLFVFSSKAEGWPNVISEALVSGLPVVSLYMQPILGYIDGTNGIMIDDRMIPEEESEKKFINAIKTIKANKKVYNCPSIRKKAIGLFSSSKLDSGYKKIYDGLIEVNRIGR